MGIHYEIKIDWSKINMNMTAVETKKQLGQFFTQNSEYILQGLEKYIKNKSITDPFAGAGDLMIWAKQHRAKEVKGFDIDENYVDGETTFLNDSILNPREYKFVLTNPPYLNINKANRQIKEKYFENSNFEDLYQISLHSIMKSEEGIVIVPINFLSAQNSESIRKEFFSKFEIVEMNYFKEQVFPDTTYNVIAFYYRKKRNAFGQKFTIKTNIYPNKKKVEIELQGKFGWLIGGDFVSEIDRQENILKIRRLTEEDIAINKGNIEIECAYNHVDTKLKWKVSKELEEKIKSNIILLKAIDSGSDNGKIALEDIRDYGVSCLVSKPTSRHMIYLVFEKEIPVSQQKKLIELFNREIQNLRDKYMSLFLTNYRDKDRKRIGFDFVYKFLNYLYQNKIAGSNQRLL